MLDPCSIHPARCRKRSGQLSSSLPHRRRGRPSLRDSSLRGRAHTLRQLHASGARAEARRDTRAESKLCVEAPAAWLLLLSHSIPVDAVLCARMICSSETAVTRSFPLIPSRTLPEFVLLSLHSRCRGRDINACLGCFSSKSAAACHGWCLAHCVSAGAPLTFARSQCAWKSIQLSSCAGSVGNDCSFPRYQRATFR